MVNIESKTRRFRTRLLVSRVLLLFTFLVVFPVGLWLINFWSDSGYRAPATVSDVVRIFVFFAVMIALVVVSGLGLACPRCGKSPFSYDPISPYSPPPFSKAEHMTWMLFRADRCLRCGFIWRESKSRDSQTGLPRE